MPDDVVPKTARGGAGTERHDAIANLRSDVAYLRQQQHGLRSKFHGELAVLALRIEDNDRRSMKRRKSTRRWAMGATAVAWVWMCYGVLHDLLGGAVLLPGLFIVVATLTAGIAIVLLNLHNKADEQEHGDRYRNWFRLTERDGPSSGAV